MKQNGNRTFHDLFSSWTEESAYILGFWFADGCIVFSRRKYNIYKRWHLINTDEQIMNDIGNIVKHDPILRLPKNKRHKILYKIQVNSQKLFDFCFNLVGSTQKSDHELELPEVPDHLFHHFVRGFFDGDGSICVKHYKTRHGKLVEALQTSFTAGLATGSFLEKLRDRIREFIPIGLKKINIGKTNKKLVFNQYDSMLLCEWIYQNTTINMSRKKMIWNDYDKEKLKNSKKFFSNKV
jgi:hypothetical protein